MSEQHDPRTIREQLVLFAQAQIVAEDADFDADTPLAAAGLDSFALVELLLFCERTFGVAVPESHLTAENLASISTLADCIARLATQPLQSRETS